MAHANQERWSKLVDAKLRNQLVTRDNYIFNNRYEGDPKAGKVKIPCVIPRSLSRTTTMPPASTRGRYHYLPGAEHRPGRGRERADRRL